MKENIVNPEEQCIYIVHADCAEEAGQLREMVEKEIPCKSTYTTFIGPIIGASVGPDTIGLYAFGKEVTYRG